MQATRERIMNILKVQGQATVDDISRKLNLSTVTIRHHLDILRGEGLVAAPFTQPCKTPGRPSHIFTLSEKANALFPKRYDKLLLYILDDLREQHSPQKVERMMRRIGQRLAEQAAISKETDLETRIRCTAQFLEDMGYMPRWERREDGSYLLQMINCPYERVSQQDPVVCLMDLCLLDHILGTQPRRVASSQEGDLMCAYVIDPAAPTELSLE